MKPLIAVLGTLRFPPENVAGVLPGLKELVTATRANDGCISYDVATDPFDPGLIRVSELWPDRESLERHLRAPHIEPWRAVARKYGILDRDFTTYDVQASGKL